MATFTFIQSPKNFNNISSNLHPVINASDDFWKYTSMILTLHLNISQNADTEGLRTGDSNIIRLVCAGRVTIVNCSTDSSKLKYKRVWNVKANRNKFILKQIVFNKNNKPFNKYNSDN